MEKIDISLCVRLSRLNVVNNRLTQLDVSNCGKLTKLYCHGNVTSSIDVSKCTDLKYFWYDENVDVIGENIPANARNVDDEEDEI